MLAAGPRAVFPLEVAIYVMRLACERPGLAGRSLSQWDGTEFMRQRIAEAIVKDISAATVQRILVAHQLSMSTRSVAKIMAAAPALAG